MEARSGEGCDGEAGPEAGLGTGSGTSLGSIRGGARLALHHIAGQVGGGGGLPGEVDGGSISDRLQAGWAGGRRSIEQGRGHRSRGLASEGEAPALHHHRPPAPGAIDIGGAAPARRIEAAAGVATGRRAEQELGCRAGGRRARRCRGRGLCPGEDDLGGRSDGGRPEQAQTAAGVAPGKVADGWGRLAGGGKGWRGKARRAAGGVQEANAVAKGTCRITLEIARQRVAGRAGTGSGGETCNHAARRLGGRGWEEVAAELRCERQTEVEAIGGSAGSGPGKLHGIADTLGAKVLHRGRQEERRRKRRTRAGASGEQRRHSRHSQNRAGQVSA